MLTSHDIRWNNVQREITGSYKNSLKLYHKKHRSKLPHQPMILFVVFWLPYQQKVRIIATE